LGSYETVDFVSVNSEITQSIPTVLDTVDKFAVELEESGSGRVSNFAHEILLFLNFCIFKHFYHECHFLPIV
jgi:hypothetical protein